MSRFITAIELLRTDKRGFVVAFYNHIVHTGITNVIPDVLFLKLTYWIRMGKRLNLNEPKTFNEKIQWLKLNGYKTEYTNMVDKYAVKDYVESIIGKEYVIPTLGVWSKFEDIDFEELPKQFVMKCTHDSGSIVICRDKNQLDINKARRILERGLKRNLFYWGRERPYKNVKPQIIIEQYMQDGVTSNLNVYKVFNFNGEPRLIQTIQNDKTAEETIDYFDTQWNLIELRQDYPNSKVPFDKPKALEEILLISKKLSQGFPFLRTDFYIVNGRVYFSEFTFYSDCGFARFEPQKWDEILGEWIDLPND